MLTNQELIALKARLIEFRDGLLRDEARQEVFTVIKLIDDVLLQRD